MLVVELIAEDNLGFDKFSASQSTLASFQKKVGDYSVGASGGEMIHLLLPIEVYELRARVWFLEVDFLYINPTGMDIGHPPLGAKRKHRFTVARSLLPGVALEVDDPKRFSWNGRPAPVELLQDPQAQTLNPVRSLPQY